MARLRKVLFHSIRLVRTLIFLRRAYFLKNFEKNHLSLKQKTLSHRISRVISSKLCYHINILLVITGEEDECTLISVIRNTFACVIIVFRLEESFSSSIQNRKIGMNEELEVSSSISQTKIINTGSVKTFSFIVQLFTILVMRTEGVQKLILNSSLIQKMIFEVVQEKNIRFSAINFDSKIQTFILRVKSKFEFKFNPLIDENCRRCSKFRKSSRGCN